MNRKFAMGVLSSQRQRLYAAAIFVCLLVMTSGCGGGSSSSPTPASPAAAVISSFTASGITITSGASVTLSWMVSNAAKLSINNIPVTGNSYTATPTLTTIYTLTATNAAGASVSRMLTVTVVGQPEISSLTAASALIEVGASTTLNWTVSNATTLTLTEGSSSSSTDVTTVDVSGMTNYTVSPTQDTIYTLTAANAAGQTTAAQVEVDAEAAPTIGSFAAASTTIAAGRSTVLNIDYQGAKCTLNGSSACFEGSNFITPASTATYTLAVSNDLGDMVTQQLTVTVLPSVFYLTASSPSVGASGNSVTLSWQTGGAPTSLSLAATSGSLTATTDVTGTTSLAVSPTAATSYVLTATNSAGTATSLPVAVATTTSLNDITSFLAYQTSTVTNSTPAVASTGSGGKVYLVPVFAAGDTATIKDAAGNAYCSGAVSSGTACAVNPAATTTYTLTVANPMNTAKQSQALRVVVGNVTAFSGVGDAVNNTEIFSDGGAASAQFEEPTSLATDAAGNVYLADYYACVVEKLDTSGNASRAAGMANNCATGSGAAPYPIDGNAEAQATFGFDLQGGLAVDSAGAVYVGDSASYEIRKISGGVVSTPAGAPTNVQDQDGTGAAAGFGSIYENVSADQGIAGLAVDSLGEVIVAEYHTMRVMDGGGKVTTLAGDPLSSNVTDGTGKTGNGADSVLFKTIAGIAIDAATDTLYLADDNSIRVMTPNKSTATAACPGAACWTWTVTTWINPSDISAYVDGPAATAQFGAAGSIVRASDATLFVKDGSYIRRITPAGTVDTFAGSGTVCSGQGFPDYSFCSLPNSTNTVAAPLPGVILPRYLAVDPTQNRLFFDVNDVASIYTIPY